MQYKVEIAQISPSKHQGFEGKIVTQYSSKQFHIINDLTAVVHYGNKG
jgi:hypothetical protein